ncbi:MAG TPA: hypothetical protein VI916_11355 [Acidimicrobiia bacterium]|nr:hypothetical protein [Acidimicrobiia bacterium]
MAINEAIRHEIYEAFKTSFGDHVADGLMEMLPPVGWADVATKHDLEGLRTGLEERMELRFQLVDQRFDLMEARIGERLERALRAQSARFIGAMAATFVAFGFIDRLLLA